MCRIIFTLITLLLVCHSLAQQPDESSLRYHSALLNRPAPGILFDRFYNAWLDSASIESLETFLLEQVAAEEGTAHRLILAYFYSAQRNHPEAIEQFEIALANDPQNAEARFHKAQVRAGILDLDGAIADLKSALEADPSDELSMEIRKLQGSLLTRADQRDEALGVWEELLSEFPDDEELHEDLIELQVTEGLLSEAIANAEALIGKTNDPYQWVTRTLRLGDIHQRAEDRDAALATYSSTLEKVGNGTWLEKEVISQIEELYRRQDDITGLAAYFEALTETHPNRIALKERLAHLSKDLGDYEQAVALYEEILKLTPGERSYRESYADLLAAVGEVEKALGVVEQLIEAHPEDSELSIRSAELYHRSGQSEKASDAVVRYVENSDSSEYAYLRAARILERFGLIDEASAQFETTRAAFPYSMSVTEAYAGFLYKHERTDEAIALWKQSAEGADRSQLVRIAEVLSSRNESETAFELMRERYEDFSLDPLYLGELCKLASALDRYDEALPWARLRLNLSTTPSDVEEALHQIIRIAEVTESTSKLTEELTKGREKEPGITLQETFLLAELLEMQDQSRIADNILEQMTPSNPEEKLLLARQRIKYFSERGSWEQLSIAADALVQMPNGRRADHVQMLAQIYIEAYRQTVALKWVAEWKKLSPGSTQPWIIECRLLQEQGKHDEAADALRQAVRLFESDSALRHQLASLYAEQGNLAEAEQVYWRLYDDADTLSDKLIWVSALTHLAEIQGKRNDLIEVFEGRRRTNRASVEPLLALAEVHRITRNNEGRRQALLEAIRLKPEDLDLLHEIARIEEGDGDWQGALRTLERALPFDSTSKTQVRIVHLQLRYGDRGEGLQMLTRLGEHRQMDTEVIEKIATALIINGDWARSIEFLNPFVLEHPNHYRIGYLYGVALEENLQFPDAIDAFTRLLDIDQELPQNNSYAAPLLNSGRDKSQNDTPDGYLTLRQFLDSREDVYSYHEFVDQAVTNSRSPWSRLPIGSIISIPPSVDRISEWVIPHIKELATYLDDDALEQLYRRLGAKDVPYPSYLLSDNYNKWNELMRHHSDDLALSAYWVLHEMHSDHATLEAHTNAFKALRSEFPDLAIMAGLRAHDLFKGEAKALWDEILELLEEVNATGDLISALSQLLPLGDDAAPPKISIEDRTRILNLFAKWQLEVDSRLRIMIFNIRAEALRDDENNQVQLAEMLNEELKFIMQSADSILKFKRGVSHVIPHIQSPEAAAHMIESLDPRPTDSLQILSNYGVVCELLKESDRARKAFSEVLELDPVYYDARYELFVMISEDEPETAAALLLGFSAEQLNKVGNDLYSLIAGAPDIKTALRWSRIIINLPEKHAHIEHVDIEWGLGIVRALAAKYMDNSISIPSIYARNSAVDENEPLVRERESLHDRFCYALLSNPSVARKAFTLLAARHLHNGNTEFDYEGLAMRALMTTAFDQLDPMYLETGILNPIRMQAPEDVLVEQAYINGNLEELTNKGLTTLQETGKVEIARMLEARIALYTCAELEFLDLAIQFVSDGGQVESVKQNLGAVITVWERRQLEVPLDPLIETLLQQNRLLFSAQQWIQEYTNALIRMNDKDTVARMVELMAERCLGPENQRVQLVADISHGAAAWRETNATARARSFASVLAGLSNHEMFFFSALFEFRRYGFHHSAVYTPPHIAHWTENDIDVETLFRLLQHSPYLGNATEFKLFQYPNGPQRTVFSTLMESIKADDNKRVAIREAILNQDPDTFGSEVTLAYLDADSGQLGEVLGNHFDVLKGLSEDHQDEFVLLLEDYYPDNAQLSNLSNRAKETLNSFRTRKNQPIEDSLDAYLSEDGPLDLNHSLFAHTSDLLHYLIARHDVERSRELLKHFAIAISNGSGKGGDHDGVLLLHNELVRLLDSVLSDSTGFIFAFDHFPVVLQLLRNPVGSYEIPIDSRILNHLMSSIQNEFKERESLEDNPIAAFQAFYTQLSRHVGSLQCSFLGPSLSVLFARYDDRSIETIIQWLESEVDSTSLSKEFAMAARLHRSMAPMQELDIDRSAEEKHYLYTLSDEFPCSWRLATAESLLTVSGDRAHPDLIIKAAEALVEAWRSGSVLVSNATADLVRFRFLNARGAEHPLWHSTGKDLAEAWFQFRSRSANFDEVSYSRRDDLPMLTLSLVCGAKDVASSLIRETQTLRNDPDVLLLLLEHDAFDLAHEQLESEWPVMGVFPNYTPFSSELEAKLNLLLSRIDDQSLVYFTKILFASLSDLADLPSPILAQKERLERLARDFEQIEFTQPLLKDRCLELLLAVEGDTGDWLEEAIIDRAAHIEVSRLIGLEDQALRNRELRLLSARIGIAVANLDTKALLDHLKQMSRGNLNFTHSNREVILSLLHSKTDAITKHWATWDKESFVKMIPVMEQMLAIPVRLPDLLGWQDCPTFLNIAFSIYALSDRLSDFDHWHHSFAPAIQDEIASLVRPDEVLNSLASGISFDPDKEEERITLLSNILNHPLILKQVQTSHQLLPQLIDLGFLSTKSIITHRDRLLELLPRSPDTVAFMAQLLASEGRVDEALTYWDQAMALLSGPDTWHYAEFHLEKVTALQRVNRFEEALLLFECVDWDSLHPNIRLLSRNQIDLLWQDAQDAGVSGDVIDLAVDRLNENPQNNEAWLALAFIYKRGGNLRLPEDDSLLEACTALAKTILDRNPSLMSGEANALRETLAESAGDSQPDSLNEDTIEGLEQEGLRIPDRLHEWLAE